MPADSETKTDEKKSNFLWPKINDEASAMEAAKAGAVGGGLMILGLLIPIAFMFFSGDPLVAQYETQGGFYIAQAIQIALAGFLTWRVWSCKGRFSSILLLLWITVEVGLKIASGQLGSPGFIIMWAFAWLSLLHSIRGHWKLHTLRKENA